MTYVVIWWIFVSLMWLHTAKFRSRWKWYTLWFDEFLYLWCDYIQPASIFETVAFCCDLMNFCIFDVITYSLCIPLSYSKPLWFDEFLYLWCDYIQLIWETNLSLACCDLMNFCIFDVITYSKAMNSYSTNSVVIWWIFVSLMWLHTAKSN